MSLAPHKQGATVVMRCRHGHGSVAPARIVSLGMQTATPPAPLQTWSPVWPAATVVWAHRLPLVQHRRHPAASARRHMMAVLSPTHHHLHRKAVPWSHCLNRRLQPRQHHLPWCVKQLQLRHSVLLLRLLVLSMGRAWLPQRRGQVSKLAQPLEWQSLLLLLPWPHYWLQASVPALVMAQTHHHPSCSP